jgi:hypothetical protein
VVGGVGSIHLVYLVYLVRGTKWTRQTSTYRRLRLQPLWVQWQGSPVLASRQLAEQHSFPGSAGHVQFGCAHGFSAMVSLLLPLRRPSRVRKVFGRHWCPFVPDLASMYSYLRIDGIRVLRQLRSESNEYGSGLYSKNSQLEVPNP